MTPGEESQRQAVIAEAETWLDTPFHHEARIKGVGVDCGQILIAVFAATGLIPDFSPLHYSYQQGLHRTDHAYLHLIAMFAREIPGPPLPGDIAIWEMGRDYSHAALVVAWPRIIHAAAALETVLLDDGLESSVVRGRLVKFYRFEGWA